MSETYSLMNQSAAEKPKARKFTPIGIIFAILGLLLFAYVVRRAGIGEVIAGIRRLGAGFLLILAISAERQVVRCRSWMMCFATPPKLSLAHAFRSRCMGNSGG